jgi:hypothetical protein
VNEGVRTSASVASAVTSGMTIGFGNFRDQLGPVRSIAGKIECRLKAADDDVQFDAAGTRHEVRAV